METGQRHGCLYYYLSSITTVLATTLLPTGLPHLEVHTRTRAHTHPLNFDAIAS